MILSGMAGGRKGRFEVNIILHPLGVDFVASCYIISGNNQGKVDTLHLHELRVVLGGLQANDNCDKNY